MITAALFFVISLRNRPDIRLQYPVSAPAPVSKILPDFCRIFHFLNVFFFNLEIHIFRHILTRIPKNQNFFHKTLKNQKKFRLIMNMVV